MLEGMTEIAEQIFDLPVRRGSPERAGGLADHVNNPAFACPVGLVAYTHRNSPFEGDQGAGGMVGRFTERLRTLFKEFF
jgi:cell division protein FtsA